MPFLGGVLPKRKRKCLKAGGFDVDLKEVRGAAFGVFYNAVELVFLYLDRCFAVFCFRTASCFVSERVAVAADRNFCVLVRAGDEEDFLCLVIEDDFCVDTYIFGILRGDVPLADEIERVRLYLTWQGKGSHACLTRGAIAEVFVSQCAEVCFGTSGAECICCLYIFGLCDLGINTAFECESCHAFVEGFLYFAFGFFVAAFTDVVVDDVAVDVDQVFPRPVEVVVCAPCREVVVEGDGEFYAEAFDGVCDIFVLVFKLELGRVDADDLESFVFVLFIPCV